MRFMIIRKADAETEAEQPVMPSSELLMQMGEYNEELAKAGVLIGGDGLQPSAKGARIKFHDGEPTVTEGPFAETEELIAGFTLIKVDSYEEALDWVKRWPPLDGHGNAELELRRLYEAEDFGDELTPELREQEDRLREQAAANADN